MTCRNSVPENKIYFVFQIRASEKLKMKMTTNYVKHCAIAMIVHVNK